MTNEEGHKPQRLDQILDDFEALWNLAPGPDLQTFFSKQWINCSQPKEEEQRTIVEVLQIDYPI